MKIAVLGTRGVPAKYGGFETFAEKLASGLVRCGHEVTVFCEACDSQLHEYNGIKLAYVPAPALGGLRTILFDVLCLFRARKAFDVVYMLGYGASIFCWLPRIWNTQVWINMDGLEWKRAKWGWAARTYLKLMEFWATVIPQRM